MKKRRPTIKDIANLLNISPSTVSRALKDHPEISSKTKDRIKSLAKKLNYKPNNIALSLKNQKSKTIGVIIPKITHYFFSSVLSGIEDIFYQAGYTVIFCQTNELYEREVNLVETLIEKGVDGIIICISKNTTKYNHLEELKTQGIPLTFVDRVVPQVLADKVIIDDFKAAYSATKFLIEKGRKNLLHLASSENLLIAKHRKDGFLAAIDDANSKEITTLIEFADTYEKAVECIERILQSERKIDGVFAVNDLAAIGAMHTLQKRDILVPEDVSIMGFSDILSSQLTTPKLSTVNQHGYEIGTTASKLLLKRVNSEEDYPYVQKVVDAELVIREST